MPHAGLDRALSPGEKVLADNGYTDEPNRFVTTSKHISGQIKFHKLLMARHTTLNKQFKDWSSLRGLFRHRKTTQLCTCYCYKCKKYHKISQRGVNI